MHTWLLVSLYICLFVCFSNCSIRTDNIGEILTNIKCCGRWGCREFWLSILVPVTLVWVSVHVRRALKPKSISGRRCVRTVGAQIAAAFGTQPSRNHLLLLSFYLSDAETLSLFYIRRGVACAKWYPIAIIFVTIRVVRAARHGFYDPTGTMYIFCGESSYNFQRSYTIYMNSTKKVLNYPVVVFRISCTPLSLPRLKSVKTRAGGTASRPHEQGRSSGNFFNLQRHRLK